MPFFARENESFLRINFCFFLIGLLFSWAKNGINGRRHFIFNQFIYSIYPFLNLCRFLPVKMKVFSELIFAFF